MKTALLSSMLIVVLNVVGATRAEAVENPRSGVSLAATLADARQLTVGRSDLQVVRIEGDSMLPFFGTGAVLVVKAISAAKLKPGMVVVYRNRFAETVAHRVISNEATGAVVQGYNNAQADSTRVDDTNLLGVVYATFHSKAEVTGSRIAAVDTSVLVALAAPAR
jgi:signal peptidase I